MGMTIDDCIHKLDFSIGAYQKLIDENVANGEVVGTGVRGTWTASTPLNKAYSDMIEALQTAKETMRKYQQLQADYENRLKADLKAILVELQLEIKEMDSGCGWEGYRPTAQVLEVIQQKINELKQEPTTKNDLGVDCISRADALDCVNWGYCFSDIYKKINELPSVTQEPRKGYWIGHREHCENLGVIPSGLGAYEWCSNCDCGIDVKEWHRSSYNYCPNCGADMREVEE